ncbi:hypothetical protein M9Y10_020345 [Tritrichomonas musculus]|uniref:Arf-GAP domain-containing protein n=1 Tax=Tritrichomonas musculus TaxID=1915356 RepID=A0ABR2HFW6_9EUKA
MSSPKNRVLKLTKQPENQLCAECKARNPRWGLPDLGIFVCMDCYKYHKSIDNKLNGKSLGDDTWTSEEALMMERVGNHKSNQYYEYFLPTNFRRPIPYNAAEMTNFIKEKYKDEYWAEKGKLHPNSKVGQFLKDVDTIVTAGFRLAIIAFTLISVIILFLLNYFKLLKIAQAISLNFIIYTEVLIVKYGFSEIGLCLISEIIVEMTVFRLDYVKAFVVVASAKLIRNGISGEYHGLLLFIVAGALIYIGFGLENMIISIITPVIMLFAADSLFDGVKLGKIKLFFKKK